MRLICIVLVFLLALMTSAQCQQTAEVWCNKGIALADQNEYDEAIKAYDEAIRLDPDDAEAWYHKGIALEALGKIAEATAAFIKADELGYTTGP